MTTLQRLRPARPALLLIVLSLCACATSPTGRSQLLLISPQAAIAHSATAYLATVRQLDEDNKLLDDPLLADRVQGVAGRVVAEAVARYPRTALWDWSVALIDDPETVNAWCMAGGRMGVYNGLFETLQLTDDEFAHIMGHEVAHAIANHTAERMSVALAAQVGLVAVAAAVDADDENALQGAALAAQLAIALPNSRVAESEADRIGIELASRAGYDPAATVSLWRKMEEHGGGLPQFLSTHPNPANRRRTLAALAPEMRELMPDTPRQPHPVTMLR